MQIVLVEFKHEITWCHALDTSMQLKDTGALASPKVNVGLRIKVDRSGQRGCDPYWGGMVKLTD